MKPKPAHPAGAAKPSPKKGPSGPPPKRIFLVDDHPMMRDGMSRLIDSEPGLICCGGAKSAEEAINEIVRRQPDLVVTDITLPNRSGLDLIKDIKAMAPETLVVVYSMHDEAFYAERALRAGAGGYVMKQEAPQVLLTAIRTVLAGQVYVSGKMGATLLQRMVSGKKREGGLPMDRLTDRELEVFRMIGSGKSVKDIADDLFLSVKTVEAHREHIKEKLNIKSSAELLRFAIRNSPDAR